MKELWLFAFCLLLASCDARVKPTAMTDNRLAAGLRACGIDPADAVQVHGRVNGKPDDYLVFRRAEPYPDTKMRCLARTLVRADYGVRKSGQPFEEAYASAWKAEFAIHIRERATSWLREHRPGESPPRFVPGQHSLGNFARELEKFCGARRGALSVEQAAFQVPPPEDEPQSECLLAAALAANPEKHGFAVQPASYE